MEVLKSWNSLLLHQFWILIDMFYPNMGGRPPSRPLGCPPMLFTFLTSLIWIGEKYVDTYFDKWLVMKTIYIITLHPTVPYNPHLDKYLTGLALMVFHGKKMYWGWWDTILHIIIHKILHQYVNFQNSNKNPSLTFIPSFNKNRTLHHRGGWFCGYLD